MKNEENLSQVSVVLETSIDYPGVERLTTRKRSTEAGKGNRKKSMETSSSNS